jgi:hypothetical protein
VKVNWEGREFWIEFAYRKEVRHADGEPREVTVCLIREAVPLRPGTELMNLDREQTMPIVAQGTVVRYWLDAPDREVARKQALTRALLYLDNRFPIECGGYPSVASLREKCRRRLFWQAYLGRKGARAEAAR